MKVFVFLFMILVTQVSTYANASDVDYNYIKGDPKGPENWWKLTQDWATCGNGKIQSPIDLSNAQKDSGLGNLIVSYKSASATLVNHGHEVLVQWQGDAGYLQIGSTQYSLKQIHWHNPSEHQIDGTSYDLEAHMVHISNDGNKAVIAILYKIGASNAFLEKIEDNVEQSEEKESQNLGVIDPNSVVTLRSNDPYYRYTGSLTTPPCSEGVTWTIISKVETVTNDQVEMFQHAQEKGSEENARPLQATNKRPILLYNPN